jgi:proteasome-associated ATPase
MGNRDDRFRSSYDPMFSGRGKAELPKEPAETDRAELRACGDPNCVSCNLHTGRVSSSSDGRARADEVRNVTLNEMRRIIFESVLGSTAEFMMPFDHSAPERGDPKREPPPSYIEARKAVQAYLKPVPEQTFADIVGNDDALSTLRDAIQAPVKHKALYEAYGMKMPKGALLSGPPATWRAGAPEWSRRGWSSFRAVQD